MTFSATLPMLSHSAGDARLSSGLATPLLVALLCLAACARREAPADEQMRMNVVQADFDRAANRFDQQDRLLFDPESSTGNNP